MPVTTRIWELLGGFGSLCHLKCRQNKSKDLRPISTIENVNETSASVKFKKKSKCPSKLLVWVAASTKGLSDIIYIVPSGLAINSDRYIDVVIIPYVFLPDLASSHYSTKTVGFLNDRNIEFLAKNEIPANVQKVRPIERFWYFLKAEVYKDGWCALNLAT